MQDDGAADQEHPIVSQLGGLVNEHFGRESVLGSAVGNLFKGDDQEATVQNQEGIGAVLGNLFTKN